MKVVLHSIGFFVARYIFGEKFKKIVKNGFKCKQTSYMQLRILSLEATLRFTTLGLFFLVRNIFGYKIQKIGYKWL